MLRQAFKHHAAVALLALCFAAGTGYAEEARSLDVLLVDAERLLEANARQAHPGARVTARMQPLDPRLTLAPCEDAELKARGQQHHGRIAVAVRCQRPQPWSIFLTGEVTVAVPVVVTRQPVRRGEILDRSMLVTEERHLGDLRDLYFTDAADAIGQEARRHLAEGEVVLASRLVEPIAVERGSKVQIVARRGAAQITGVGEALSSGRVGSQVRVKNLNSGRIVHGWVAGPGRVHTSPLTGTTGTGR